jgi:two-component system sensor histidine kinase/response regulator
MMGGNVGVSSVAGQGSRFWFSARLELAEAGTEVDAPQAALAGRRALVVDDMSHAGEVLAQLLGDLRFEVVTAQSGAQALEALRAGPGFDLIFLDWMMPGMDGPRDGTPHPRGARRGDAAAGDGDRPTTASRSPPVRRPPASTR